MCTANLCVAWYPVHFLPYCTPSFLEVYLGLPWSLQNGVGQSYHAGAVWYGKKFFGFLSLQVTDQRLQSVFYCGYSEVAVSLSHVWLFVTPRTVARQAPHPWELSRQEYCSGCHALLQGIFPTQRWNSGLLHCRRILYHLSHQESPRILPWVAYPFSRVSSWPRKSTGATCIAGRFFTS